jgi:hypothetical protein
VRVGLSQCLNGSWTNDQSSEGEMAVSGGATISGRGERREEIFTKI